MARLTVIFDVDGTPVDGRAPFTATMAASGGVAAIGVAGGCHPAVSLAAAGAVAVATDVAAPVARPEGMAA